ncbi:MAG: hypothetical protein ISS48_03275 [Candidatus Aenigmarchaeota archaeon]|nr:hypothetical protein [Candidatus Aenigmarchaeota archaeon]
MAKKKWSNYWKEYKSSTTPKVNHQRGERPTITISPKIHKLSKPKLNIDFKGILLTIFVLSILALGIWNSKSARTIGVLSGERTDLECQLGNCTEQLESVNASFIACGSNLKSCNSDLSKKISALNTCENEKGDINKDYKNCKDDLLQYKRDYADVKDDYDDCRDALNKKDDDLDECIEEKNSLCPCPTTTTIATTTTTIATTTTTV